jgi:hypothetical protein
MSGKSKSKNLRRWREVFEVGTDSDRYLKAGLVRGCGEEERGFNDFL